MTDPRLIWIAYCRRVLGQLTDDELADEVERLRATARYDQPPQLALEEPVAELECE